MASHQAGETKAVHSADTTEVVLTTTRLQSLAGETTDLFDVVDGTLKVILFMRTDCPIGNRYVPEILRLQERFSGKDVNFLLVYPDPAEDLSTVRQHIEDFQLSAFTVLRDPEHNLVRKTHARVTPEACVFDHQNRLIYRGRIDNRFVDFGKVRTVTTRHDLSDLLEAKIAKRATSRRWEPAVGCPIPLGTQ